MAKVTLSAKVEPGLRARLEARAEREGVKLGALVERLLTAATKGEGGEAAPVAPRPSAPRSPGATAKAPQPSKQAAAREALEAATAKAAHLGAGHVAARSRFSGAPAGTVSSIESLQSGPTRYAPGALLKSKATKAR